MKILVAAYGRTKLAHVNAAFLMHGKIVSNELLHAARRKYRYWRRVDHKWDRGSKRLSRCSEYQCLCSLSRHVFGFHCW